MGRQEINRICLVVPIALSFTACVWVLGNVAGGVRSQGDEGVGFHIFWLLILLQAPFVLRYLATAEWDRWHRVAGRLVVLGMALSTRKSFALVEVEAVDNQSLPS
jgi:hypothetical protein